MHNIRLERSCPTAHSEPTACLVHRLIAERASHHRFAYLPVNQVDTQRDRELRIWSGKGPCRYAHRTDGSFSAHGAMQRLVNGALTRNLAGLAMSLLCQACEAPTPRLPRAVTHEMPVLSSSIKRELSRSWLGITRRNDNVFGCLHGRVIRMPDSSLAVLASRVQLAYVDGGDCYGPDAVGIVEFFGPKPTDFISYYLVIAERQRRLLCGGRIWLVIGAIYDTTGGQLRTSWLSRTPSNIRACQDSGYLPTHQMVIDLPRRE